MSESNHAALEAAIADAQAAVTQQGDIVRSLKAKAKDGAAEKVRIVMRRFGLIAANSI